MTDNPLSKDAQLERSPGGNRMCPRTGQPKRSCKCKPCLGRRNRRKGKGKQNTARKQLGFTVATRAAGGQEELWDGPWRVEVKSGGKAKTVDTFYRNCRKQADAAKAIGNVRPFMAVAMPDGMSGGYVVVKLSDWREIVRLAAGGME